MTIEVRVPEEADWLPLVEVDGRAFASPWTPERLAVVRPSIDLSRFRIACDGPELVGLAGSFAFDVTLPGGSCVPAGGLTWVAVSASHRRQGILRSLITAVHNDMHDRGEPLALLRASEGSIYERFGYGIAHHESEITLDVRAATLRPEFVVAPGSVRYLVGEAALDHIVQIWEASRRCSAGELSRSPVWHRMMFENRAAATGNASSAFHLAHTGGFVSYRVEQDWNFGLPRHKLIIVDFAAITVEAHVALWNMLLSIDLIGTITSSILPIDDPLRYMLTNARALRTTDLSDGMWALPFDVRTCFGARTYGTSDRLVVEVDGKRWAIDGSPDGGDVTPVRSKPDLVTRTSALGPLLFGGVRAAQLAAGGQLQARSDEALRRADRFFLGDRLSASSTFF